MQPALERLPAGVVSPEVRSATRKEQPQILRLNMAEFSAIFAQDDSRGVNAESQILKRRPLQRAALQQR